MVCRSRTSHHLVAFFVVGSDAFVKQRCLPSKCGILKTWIIENPCNMLDFQQKNRMKKQIQVIEIRWTTMKYKYNDFKIKKHALILNAKWPLSTMPKVPIIFSYFSWLLQCDSVNFVLYLQEAIKNMCEATRSPMWNEVQTSRMPFKLKLRRLKWS